MNPIHTKSVWQQMISMLCQTGQYSREDTPSTVGIRRSTSTGRYSPEDLNIRILERMSGHTVSISWGHSCAGYFGLQTWREARSRKSGVCALSGDSIAPGDKIYKLFRPASAAHGRNESLLASHVEAILAARENLEHSLRCELFETE